MSALPATERDYLLAHIEKRHAAAWPKVDRQIRQALGQVERFGYCVSPGVRRPEITAVAVPLVARDQSSVLTIACAAATPFLSTDRIHQQLGPDLVALANGLRHDLPMTDY
jgi:DNA-binding IclR family transcriptional regulator